MTAENKTHTATYLLRANTVILQNTKTSGTQNVLNFPQASQEQWLTSLIFLNNHRERLWKGKIYTKVSRGVVKR